MENRKGKLIILEAGDASGKETQTRLLYERLMSEGRDVTRVSFPDYESDSSALVRMYLRGDFGTQAADVDAYAASAFFAVDRYASFHMKWGEMYRKGGVILSDRYTTSNLAHQAVKLADKEARHDYFSWLEDFEYSRLGLPRPRQRPVIACWRRERKKRGRRIFMRRTKNTFIVSMTPMRRLQSCLAGCGSSAAKALRRESRRILPGTFIVRCFQFSM